MGQIEKKLDYMIRICLKSFVLVALAVTVFLSPNLTYAWTGKVVGISDGDIITVMNNGRGEKIWINFEKTAKAEKLGLWAENNPVPPLDFRKGSANVQTESLSPSKNIVYHGHIKSKKFHRPSCRYYNCKNCTAVFNSKEEAINSGYIPCKICKP